MTMRTGIHTLADLLSNTGTAQQVDMSQVNQVLQDDLATHNELMNDLMSEIAAPVTDALVGEGTGIFGEMIEADELSRAPTQKAAGFQNLGFPMKTFQFALGWTQRFINNNPVSVLARASLGGQLAHRKKVLAELKRALFFSANYTAYDYNGPNQSLAIAVKRLLNADSWTIRDGPNGETFNGATHTHYIGNATLTAAAVQSLIDTIAEHGHTQAIRLVINVANEAAVRALTGFVPYTDARLIPTAGTAETNVDIRAMNNRAIGFFGMAEIWVKPYAIANYIFGYDVAGPKPVGFRQRGGGVDGLRIVAENDAFPLIAQYLEADFGFGINTRSNGGVLYFANATYANPTITG